MSDAYDKWMHNNTSALEAQQRLAESNQRLEQKLGEMQNQANQKFNELAQRQYEAYQKMADAYSRQPVPYTPYTTSSASGTDALTETKIKDLLDKLMPSKNTCPNCGKEIDGDTAYRIHQQSCWPKPVEHSPQESINPKTTKPIKDLENLIDGLYE